MNWTTQCPSCHGSGSIIEYVCCCDNGEYGCCGTPIEQNNVCPLCEGSLQVDATSFLDFAIRTRNRALLAEYEANNLLCELNLISKPDLSDSPKSTLRI